jgi:hypothetical protein
VLGGLDHVVGAAAEDLLGDREREALGRLRRLMVNWTETRPSTP